jgi:IclR family transcriptional regulator, pca regulon regulatory protein
MKKNESGPQTRNSLKAFEGYKGDPNFVLSLARGLRVIESFAGHTEGMTVGEVSLQAGVSRAAARRLLLTLEMLGYTENSRRNYRLKTRVLELGFSYLSSTSLVAAAQPILERITESLHESASMSVLDGDQITYVARSHARRVMSIGLSVGSRLPAYCTSMGRVLLAGLPETELAAYLDHLKPKMHTPKTVVSKQQLRKAILQAGRDGYACIDEELELGLRAIAVPVLTRQNRVLAAINIGAHVSRVERKEMIRCFLPVLQKSAMALSDAVPNV